MESINDFNDYMEKYKELSLKEIVMQDGMHQYHKLNIM